MDKMWSPHVSRIQMHESVEEKKNRNIEVFIKKLKIKTLKIYNNLQINIYI